MDSDFGFMPVLLNRENHLGIEFVAKNFADFGEAGFNIFSISGSNFVVPASVFHAHVQPPG
jgi:hypothetical protein